MINPYRSKTLDHLGLVAGMCDELGISEYVDGVCPSGSPDQFVSTGKAVEAMILNGLGFVNKRLYLVRHFFEDKPIERLLGPGISADQLNDDRLGRALDELYDRGLTTLFSGLSQQSIARLGLRLEDGHLDSTSLSVYGGYNSEEEVSEGELHITRGYSKDQRPDLAQVTLQLICSRLHSIPLHMEVLNGNSSDSVSFRKTIEEFGKQLHQARGLRTIIADGKLYCEQTLGALSQTELNWISRVPSTLSAAKEIFTSVQTEELEPIGQAGYRAKRYASTYAGVKQDWVVYHSQAAEQRESKTLARRLEKEAEQARKQLKQLSREAFHCQADAQQAAQKFSQSLKWMQLDQLEIQVEKHFKKPGRPKSGEVPQRVYLISGEVVPNQAKIDRLIFEKSLFMLATNQACKSLKAQAQLLTDYKDQGSVERGFRFIKDPRVVASSIYLKKPQRVAALLFVMTCCLLVYSALEYRIRTQLQQQNQSVPDQKGKPTQTPTARWIFELFIGIHVLTIQEKQTIVLNLNPNQLTIIQLLGYDHFYS